MTSEEGIKRVIPLHLRKTTQNTS